MRDLKLTPRWLRLFLLILLVTGVFFRFFHLDYKIYWHDEAYTSIRAAGFTRQEIDQEIFQNHIIPAPYLLKFQRLKPGSTVVDTINSLKIEDPHHPPLYFLMARFWMQMFGSSLTASRTLPALLSLLALPLMYALGVELFASTTVALFATVLLALSPFDILFAQTARQYSLLTVAVIGSNFLLLRAWRLSTWQNWSLYTFSNIIGWYTHPFFGLTVAAQGTYIFLGRTFQQENRQSTRKNVIYFLVAIASSLILYLPWLVVLVTNRQRALETTSWTGDKVDIWYLLKLWLVSFSSLFFDLDFGFDTIWNGTRSSLLKLAVMMLIAGATYLVCHQTKRVTWLFIITTILVPFLSLALPDLLLGGRRSTVSRYLISSYPGVQLAVAYLLGTKIISQRWLWQGVTLLIFTGSIASATVSASAHTWWSKDLSYHNFEIINRINGSSSPVIVSDIGDEYTNTGDLIAQSYSLQDHVRLLLLTQPTNLENANLNFLLSQNNQLLTFRPSQQILGALKQNKKQVLPVFEPGRLWQIKNTLTQEVNSKSTNIRSK